ncbi:hypothetical protein FACS1894193_02290 [Bacilli bacterium]|nr:hypothetical protein FACS1894193_02290 [Bacilli bacterium]
MATFAERLKMLRKEKKLTQTELAERLETTQGTVGKWENEKLEPNLEKVIELAKELGATTDYLLGFDDVNPYDLPEEAVAEYGQSKEEMLELFRQDSLRLKNMMKEDLIKGFSMEKIKIKYPVDTDDYLQYLLDSAIKEIESSSE